MKDLIEALTIFQKYRDVPYPTHCEHDVLHVVCVHERLMNPEDAARLKKLSFCWEPDSDSWISMRFGSC